MMVRVGRKNSLDKLEEQVAQEIEKKRRKRKKYNSTDRSRIAAGVRAGRRLPPAVPKNRSLAEIEEMHPQHKAFRHPDGRPRTYYKEGTVDEFIRDPEEMSFRDLVRADMQKRANERRGRVRRWEARVSKAQDVLETHTTSKEHSIDIYDEEKAIAEGILSLEDWDNEELIRGYRRGRNGKFGPSPKYIPREVQQEAFRRLVHRGNRKLRGAYMATIEVLIDLAHNADSEKVRLEATRALLDRVVGKVPDVVIGAQMEQPWESILGDSLIPYGEGGIEDNTIDLDMDDDGVARAAPIVLEAETVEVLKDNKERAKSKRRKPASDPGDKTAADVAGSGTGSPTSGASSPGSPARRTKKTAARKKAPVARGQTTVARKTTRKKATDE